MNSPVKNTVSKPHRSVNLWCCALWLAVATACGGNGGAPSPPPVFPPSTPPSGLESIVVDGQSRTYKLVSPSIAAGARVPLVIALHGGNDSGAGIEMQSDLSTAAPARGMAVVYPNAIGEVNGLKYWNDGRLPEIDDVKFIGALIDDLVARRSIDPERVYVTGFSNGASMTNKIGVELSTRIAGIAPIAGSIGIRVADRWRPEVPMPLIYFHATTDPFVYYYDGGSVGTYRGSALPAEDYVHWWGIKNRCNAAPTIDSVPNSADDGTTVERWTLTGCRSGGDVQFLKIDGGGHTWPGGVAALPESVGGKVSRDISASQLMLDFFLSFRRVAPEALVYPPSWIGAQRLSCQWHHRALAQPPKRWTPDLGKAYGEDSNVSYFYWGYPPGELPEGTKVHIEGEFPYARYFEFQVSPPWDPQFANWRGGRGAPLVPLLDEDIEPLPGHVNPYRAGANRNATDRSYRVTFELRAGNPVALNPQAMVPPYRAPGNVRIGGHRSGGQGELGPYIEINMNAPDRHDPYGGVALPRITIERPGTAAELAPPIRELYFRNNQDPNEWLVPYTPESNPCLTDGWAQRDVEQWELRRTVSAQKLAAIRGPGTIDPRGPARANPDGTPQQHKAFGISRHACFLSLPLADASAQCPQQDLSLFNRGPNQPPPGNDEHTNGWDMFNSYIFGFASFPSGQALVFSARAPQVPRTIVGNPTMEASNQLRYWSLCIEAGAPTVIPLDCVMDENVVTNVSGNYMIVISTEADRPSNALPECGVTWMQWRVGGAAFVWSIKSTEPTRWVNALQNVSWTDGDPLLPSFKPSVVQDTLGAYFPQPSYQTKAQIEALGCPVS